MVKSSEGSPPESSDIRWWKTSFGEEEIQRVAESIRNKNISQGEVTRLFEAELEQYLSVKHVVAVSSGSAALLSALIVAGIRPGDEVIIPNRTWIATAHAVMVLGARVIPVDVEPYRPIIDANLIERAITPRTRAVIPVHMNGRAADMKAIADISRKYGLFLIEDAAQAVGSRNERGFLGTQSDIGCFSLSVAKTIATGQGGFCVTGDDEIACRLRLVRTHGVENTKDPERWHTLGFNFRFTDIQASIGLEQLKRLPGRITRLLEIYRMYRHGLDGSAFSLIPTNLNEGEVPVYSEFMVEDRDYWAQKLADQGIETRRFYPNVSSAHYLEGVAELFPNSIAFERHGIYLPSGPSQSDKDIHRVIDMIVGGHV